MVGWGGVRPVSWLSYCLLLAGSSRRISFFFFLFREAAAAYGNSQAGVKLELQLKPVQQTQQGQILNPLSKARDRTWILMDTMLGSEPTEPQW